MTINKIYIILLSVWLGINILITLCSMLSGKSTKRSVKQLLSDVFSIQGILSKKEVVSGQLIPVDEIVKELNKFEEKCIQGKVTQDDYDKLYIFMAQIAEYFKKDENNGNSST